MRRIIALFVGLIWVGIGPSPATAQAIGYAGTAIPERLPVNG